MKQLHIESAGAQHGWKDTEKSMSETKVTGHETELVTYGLSVKWFFTQRRVAATVLGCAQIAKNKGAHFKAM